MHFFSFSLKQTLYTGLKPWLYTVCWLEAMLVSFFCWFSLKSKSFCFTRCITPKRVTGLRSPSPRLAHLHLIVIYNKIKKIDLLLPRYRGTIFWQFLTRKTLKVYIAYFNFSRISSLVHCTDIISNMNIASVFLSRITSNTSKYVY